SMRKLSRRHSADDRVSSLGERIDVGSRCQPGVIFTRAKFEGRSLHKWIMLRRGIDICADARNCAIATFKPRHAKVGNLHGFAIARQQEILRLNVAMDDAALMRMREAGTDLLQIEERAIEAEFLLATKLRHVTAAEILQHQ